MPDSRPITTLRHGRYDDPPASSEASTPRSRRRASIHQHGLPESRRHDYEIGFGTLGSGPPLRRAAPLVDSSRPRRRPRSPEHPDSFTAWHYRATKRQKLDVDGAEPPWEAIKYGVNGQVKAGTLKMEILSSDGGEQRGQRYPPAWVANILRHDRSVYCSELDICNIVLQHKDDTPFCLEKLHIVGPERGFGSPVREGIVYVGMGFDDIRKYIDPPPYARRRDWSPRYRQNRNARLSERMTLPDALRDPLISAAMDADPSWQDMSQYEDGDSEADAGFEEEPRHSVNSNTGELSNRRAQDSHEIHSELLRHYDGARPLATLSDEELDPEEASTQEVIDRLDRRERAIRPRRFDLDADWSDDPRWHSSADRDGRDDHLSRLDTRMAQSRIRESPQHDQDPDDRHAYRTAVEENVGKVFYEDGLKDPNVTRARFYIRQGQHKVTIKFSPALSGRFILLKMWSYTEANHVEIQSVIAKGYGGCRFFPAVDLR